MEVHYLALNESVIAKRPAAWASANVFAEGGYCDIFLMIFRLLTMQSKSTFTNLCTFCTP